MAFQRLMIQTAPVSFHAAGLSSQASPHFPRDIKESSSRMAIPEGIMAPV
jgi:hypothetical protein